MRISATKRLSRVIDVLRIAAVGLVLAAWQAPLTAQNESQPNDKPAIVDDRESPDEGDETIEDGKNGRVLLPADAKRPWDKENKNSASRLSSKSKTPRDDLINVEDTELETFFFEEGLDPTDSTLIKILYRYPRIGLNFIQQYAEQTSDIGWKQLAAAPESHLLKIFTLHGRVTAFEQHALSPEEAILMDFAKYYSVTFEVDGAKAPAQVFTRRIPKAWRTKTSLNERASCTALLLKPVASKDKTSPDTLFFATHRVAWLPDRLEQEFSIGPNQLMLANLGLDIGLFDEVRPLNGRSLEAGDSECFYQMLATVARTNANDLAKAARQEMDIAPLLQRPTKQHGNLVTVVGDARRITKMVIDRAYIRDRLGIDHYYEVDVLIDLKNQRIKLGKDEPGKPALVISDSYPVTVCVRSLPAGLEVSEDINERVRIPSFFFKLWAYKSEYTRAHGAKQGQASPLLIGIEPEIVEFQRATNPYIGAIAIVLIVLAMGGIWAGLWIYGRGDKKFEKETLNKQFEVEKGKSLDDMGIESKDGPDFSDLK